MDEDENSLLVILRMKALTLLDESENATKGENDSKNSKTNEKTESDVSNNKA